MADTFEDAPPRAVGDNQAGRAEAFTAFMAAALPFGTYDTLLRNAAEHAAETARADAQNLPWISRGPRNLGGRIGALVQDPGTPATMYAGSAHGGLWKTTNAGDTWVALNGFIEGNAAKDVAAPVGAIGICHRQTQTIYVGTGEPRQSTHEGFGLFRSDDGGATFARVDPAPGSPAPPARLPGNAFNRILVDPWDAARVWLATPSGLWDIEPTRALAGRIGEINLDAPGLAAAGLNITDIAVDFGDKSQAAPPGNYTFYIGVEIPGASSRVLTAQWNPATRAFVVPVGGTAWTDTGAHTAAGIVPPPPVGVVHRVDGRVRVAICENTPAHVYAVFGTHRIQGAVTTQPHSRVVHSSDSGATWTAPSQVPNLATIPWYALCLEVDPTNPAIVIMGCMELFRTTNSGNNWTRIIDWTQYREGDRAQHGDQHAIVFDRANPRRIWIGNDGGISESSDLGTTWTKRSHGIVAGQFYEFATHPTYPFIMGGGLQDNGAWTGLGGLSWLQTGVADGGGMAFQPGRTDVLATCHQSYPNNVQLRTQNFASLRPPALGHIGGQIYDIGAHLPDRPTGVDGMGNTTFPFCIAQIRPMAQQVGTPASTIFGRPMEGHPSQGDRLVVGWNTQLRDRGGGSLNNNPPDVWHKKIAALNLVGTVSAIAFDPSATRTIWVGSTRGELYFTNNRGASWVNVTARLGIGNVEITGIAVHPTRNHVVAISTAAAVGNVLFSANARARAGANGTSAWRAISNASGTAAPPSAANRDLPASPCAQVAFDPVIPPQVGGRSVYTLFAATLSGVYVCRNASWVGGIAPLWFAMNRNMPLVLVRDLDVVETLKADGTSDRRLLRAATFGRGLYECDLNGTPGALLYIRNRSIDDGRTYRATQVLGQDPRLNVPGAGAAAFDDRRALDIRIDAPPYSVAAGAVVDGVDFDEHLRSDALQLGQRNFLYIQLHTRGHDTLGLPAGVPPPGPQTRPQVHVYYADAIAPVVPGQPHTAPPLQADFWTDFPADPVPTAVWRKAGVAEVSELSAGNPRVARLDWGPPGDLGAQVAILAVAEHPSDPVSAEAGTLPLTVDPGTAGALIPSTHRTALYITPTQAGGGVEDVAIRDGIGDSGALGEIAWGGRSADIVVVQAQEADPDAAFSSLLDARTGDRMRGGTDNHIYVRVFNRGEGTQDITVDLYAVPGDEIDTPANWVRIGVRQTVEDVAPRSARLSPVFTWAAADVPDPTPGSATKSQILVALIGSTADPTPDHTGIASLGAFWDFFLSGANANKATMRAVRYDP